MRKLEKPKRVIPRKGQPERILFIWDSGERGWEMRGLKPPLNRQWKANLEINEFLWRRLQKRGVIV